MPYNKDTHHKRSTYDQIVLETITNPKDMVALPDREATILRNDPRLTRFDDENFLNLDEDNKKIATSRVKQQALRTAVASNTYTTTNVTTYDTTSNVTNNDNSTHTYTVQQVIASRPDEAATMPTCLVYISPTPRD